MPRPQLETLESRILLSASGDSTAASSRWQVDARIAAHVGFDGPDLTGKDGPTAKIGYDLTLLAAERDAHALELPGETFTPTNRWLQVADNLVQVDVVGTGDIGALQSQLTALGMSNIATAGPMIEGSVPIASLSQIAALPGLVFARPVNKPVTAAGAVTSQGDSAMQSDVARSAFGLDGSGITVGVISDSFNKLRYADNVTGLQRDIGTGDLPAQTSILEDGSFFDTDEGRALAQVIHDVAPAPRFSLPRATEESCISPTIFAVWRPPGPTSSWTTFPISRNHFFKTASSLRRSIRSWRPEFHTFPPPETTMTSLTKVRLLLRDRQVRAGRCTTSIRARVSLPCNNCWFPWAQVPPSSCNGINHSGRWAGPVPPAIWIFPSWLPTASRSWRRGSPTIRVAIPSSCSTFSTTVRSTSMASRAPTRHSSSESSWSPARLPA